MSVALTTQMLRSHLRGRKSCMQILLGAAVTVVMLLLVNVTLQQRQFTFNNFSVPLPSPSHHNAENFMLPTRPRALNQKLYQKEVILQLNSSWTEKTRAAWVAVLQERRHRLRQACRRAGDTGNFSYQPDLLEPRSLVWATPHRLVWCPICKAGSTTWVKNLLLASGKMVVDDSLYRQLRKLYPMPASASEQERILKSSMRMIVVRHPFERLLSAYRDKMFLVKDLNLSFLEMQQKIARTYGDPGAQPFPYTAEELKILSNATHNATGLVHPTFTQFLKKVRDDLSKLRKSKPMVNKHWRPFWVACEPCHLDYDIIGHVETLSQDQEFVIRELGLQDLLRPVHTHASRFDSHNDTIEASKSYFRRVPLKLVKSLAKLLRPDFEMFGYSPDKYLAMAAQSKNNTTS